MVAFWVYFSMNCLIICFHILTNYSIEVPFFMLICRTLYYTSNIYCHLSINFIQGFIFKQIMRGSKLFLMAIDGGMPNFFSFLNTAVWMTHCLFINSIYWSNILLCPDFFNYEQSCHGLPVSSGKNLCFHCRGLGSILIGESRSYMPQCRQENTKYSSYKCTELCVSIHFSSQFCKYLDEWLLTHKEKALCLSL